MGATHAKPSGGTDTSEPDTGAVDSPADTTDDTTDDALTEDELFEILSNRRRRHILHELMREEEGALDIGTLSQEIAACEDGLELHEVSSSDRKRVYTALHQSHLPKMDKAGIIEFDRDRGTVEPTPTLDDVEIYMDVVRGREIPWSDYYITLTVVGGLLLAAASFGIGPFAALSLQMWGTFMIVALGVSSVAHRYYARRNRLGITDDPPGVDVESALTDRSSAGE